MSTERRRDGGGIAVRTLPLRIVIYASMLAGTWYVLSGKFDLLHFGTGLATALVIATRLRAVADTPSAHLIRALGFLPWLAGQVLVSNLRVARGVLSRRMPIEPTFVRMRPKVASDQALTLLGASITLTPGTLTVDAGRDELLVHALDRQSADELGRGAIARRVARIFDRDE